MSEARPSVMRASASVLHKARPLSALRCQQGTVVRIACLTSCLVGYRVEVREQEKGARGYGAQM